MTSLKNTMRCLPHSWDMESGISLKSGTITRQQGVGTYVPGMAHNDIMTHFIELGFWGFIYWLWSNTWYKVSAVKKKFGSRASGFMLLTVIYTFITYLTDNTFFYYSINIVAHITVIAYVDEHETGSGGGGS